MMPAAGIAIDRSFQCLVDQRTVEYVKTVQSPRNGKPLYVYRRELHSPEGQGLKQKGAIIPHKRMAIVNLSQSREHLD